MYVIEIHVPSLQCLDKLSEREGSGVNCPFFKSLVFTVDSSSNPEWIVQNIFINTMLLLTLVCQCWNSDNTVGCQKMSDVANDPFQTPKYDGMIDSWPRHAIWWLDKILQGFISVICNCFILQAWLNRVRHSRANPQINYGPKYGPTCHQWYHADVTNVFTLVQSKTLHM